MKRPWFAVVSALLLMLLATACTIRDSKTVCDDKDLCIKVKFICQGEERTSVDIQVNLRKESKATKPIPVKFVVEDENDAFIKDEETSVLAEPEGKVPSSGSASGFRLVAHDTATELPLSNSALTTPVKRRTTRSSRLVSGALIPAPR